MSSSTATPGEDGSPPSRLAGPLSSAKAGLVKASTKKRSREENSPPKRRGPKPNSKPALSRRQELNRQAQRTHRERKELYVKSLEDEVLRLRELYTNMSHDKDLVADENSMLRQALANQGLPVSAHTIKTNSILTSSGPSSEAVTASASPGKLPQPGIFPPSGHINGEAESHDHTQIPQRKAQKFDVDQAGIDFVLSLEKPCMQHLPWLLDQHCRGLSTATVLINGHPEEGQREDGSEDNDRTYRSRDTSCHGHALMLSCPPRPWAQPPGFDGSGTQEDGVTMSGDQRKILARAWGNRFVPLDSEIESSPTDMLLDIRSENYLSDEHPPAESTKSYTKSQEPSLHVTQSRFEEPFTGQLMSGHSHEAGSSHSYPQDQLEQQAHGRPSAPLTYPVQTQGTWKLSKGNLAALMDLSSKLDLKGEITPVMAWAMVLEHPRVAEFGNEQLATLLESLKTKVSCQGFGAVLEDRDVREALNTVFSTFSA